MKDGLIISLLSIIPKKPTARFMGYTARLRMPKIINRALLRAFVWKYNINMNESMQSLNDFHSLSDLFLRKLKPDCRNIAQNHDIEVSPVDGKVHSFGKIVNGSFHQAEDLYGSVEELIGGPNTVVDSPSYDNGSYMIIYLSPQDYHRVHAHKEGTLTRIRYLPGRLWPVFPAATRAIKSLFDRNERLIFELDTTYGSEILAMIGAFGVGRMHSPFCEIVTNTNTPPQDFICTENITRGQEVGAFGLGSTVILIWSHRDFEWLVSQGQTIQLGNPIIKHNSNALENTT